MIIIYVLDANINYIFTLKNKKLEIGAFVRSLEDEKRHFVVMDLQVKVNI